MTMEYGADFSNYQGAMSTDAFIRAATEKAIRFTRPGAQNPVITRAQLDNQNAANMALAPVSPARITSDALYVTTPAQIDAACQIASDYNIHKIAIDVEENCFEEPIDVQEAETLLINRGFIPLIYTRVSYWNTKPFVKRPETKSWVAWYIGSGAEPPVSLEDERYIHVKNIAQDAGLAPVECWQWYGTIELVEGFTCDLNAREGEYAGTSPVPATQDAGAVAVSPDAPAPVDFDDSPLETQVVQFPNRPMLDDNTPVPGYEPRPGYETPIAEINGLPFYGGPEYDRYIEQERQMAESGRLTASPYHQFLTGDIEPEETELYRTAMPTPDNAEDNAPGGLHFTQRLPFGYLEFCGVPILRFGSDDEIDAYGQPLYPGRVAFLRGDNYYYLRTKADGSVFFSLEAGE